MSAAAAQAASLRDSGKKAVHVKWAGKTIALGTFPAAEADEKCARAKALTRAWRSTMRPKPTRDWVMLELERLGVRVVSGRLGRKAGEEGDDDASEKKPGGVGPGPVLSGVGLPMERSNSLGWANSDAELNSLMMARRNSSLGLSMINDGRRGSLGSLGPAVGLDPGDVAMPPHRPLVGGGAAAAYEAARHDHFTQKSAEQQRRASSLGLGTLGGGLGGMGGMSVNPNQHYEMLKLHHMNLLNEIQETTLMMNLYQQQQLQQQQQQLQQQASVEMGGGDQSMAMLLQQSGAGGAMDMFSQRASLGLGGSQLGAGFGQQQQLQMLQQQQMMLGGQGVPTGNLTGSGTQLHDGPPDSQASLENRMAQVNKEIARSDGMGGGGPPSDDKKRPASGEGVGDEVEANKRVKSEDPGESETGNDNSSE